MKLRLRRGHVAAASGDGATKSGPFFGVAAGVSRATRWGTVSSARLSQLYPQAWTSSREGPSGSLEVSRCKEFSCRRVLARPLGSARRLMSLAYDCHAAASTRPDSTGLDRPRSFVARLPHRTALATLLCAARRKKARKQQSHFAELRLPEDAMVVWRRIALLHLSCKLQNSKYTSIETNSHPLHLIG